MNSTRGSVFLVMLVAPALLALPARGLAAESHAPGAVYITYDEARPIIEATGEAAPAELKAMSAEQWGKWVARRDEAIRERLIQGDEDSLINFLLFGTSYTARPRITSKALVEGAGKAMRAGSVDSPEVVAFRKVINSRVDDLVEAMRTPAANERLLVARKLVERRGNELETARGRERAKQYLLKNLARVLNEQVSYARAINSARLLGDASAEFAERSKLYSARGLSLDTTLMPNFAIQRSLASMKSRGLFPSPICRVAIIGPGLDFTDKQDGYDFYPQQTIQPFAVIDSLLRLGLAKAADLKVTTLDLSPRVNDHLRLARERAARKLSYTIQLPRDAGASWKPEAVEYWQRFGDQIGTPTAAAAAPARTGDIKVRAVRVRPAIVSLVTPEDVNIVLQRLELPEDEKFDLVIATNIFVYYDVFEQSLALASVARMLRAGGFLLSNNALLELPNSAMRSVDYETVVYSDRPNDGDHIVWYQRTAAK